MPSTPSVTKPVPNVKKVKKKRRTELENLKIGDDWNFNLSVTAHPYSSPQFDSSSTVSVAANAMMRAVQVQMGVDSQARVFSLGEEGDSVVATVNNMGGGDGKDDVFNSTCVFSLIVNSTYYDAVESY